MTASAEEWGAHDLDRRFDLGTPRDELTGLAATLDRLLGRIAASRRHEQRFASEVAHELRTPLTTMRGRAELALQGQDQAEQAAALRNVVNQVDRLEAAIDALIAVARQEAGGGEGRTDLRAVAASFDGVDLVDADGVPSAEGEPEIVRRALAPLVDNARKFGSGRPRLEIGTDDGSVTVSVHDDGPGPDPALGDSIFEPGVQATSSDGGAGLGLPLARRLARACGGDVVIGHGPGGCFVLRLPRADP